MEKKMEEKLEQQRMQEATLLFQQLSPEKQEEILRMMERLAEKKQTAKAVCLVP